MTNNRRPDPDQLLARVQEEEAKATRGKLKIFFGASAGVGKTYAMLCAARQQQELGADVLIGIVETHGRKETEALIAGLERLPLREIPYRGNVLKEFDLDAALTRSPALILMDELAHSNVAGSRHPKRWQDIHELLEAGIDVYSTVNVQHLETLNDVVSGIAGIRVWETVPDRVFDDADEVVLVDLPPDELLQRLQEGKVYLPQQAERAIRNFFRKGNLIALRELALRRTADRVDGEMLAYRRETSVSDGMANTRCAAGVHRTGRRRRATGAHRCAPVRATRGPLARHTRRHADLGTRARRCSASALCARSNCPLPSVPKRRPCRPKIRSPRSSLTLASKTCRGCWSAATTRAPGDPGTARWPTVSATPRPTSTWCRWRATKMRVHPLRHRPLRRRPATGWPTSRQRPSVLSPRFWQRHWPARSN
jgi:hypothetical protein